jgi:hypothetical protein
VRTERLGVVVPAGDPEALAAALERVLYDDAFAAGCRERMAAVAQRYTWETALAPLVEFCRRPVPAADRLAGVPRTAAPLTGAPLTGSQRRGIAGTLRRDAALVREYLAAGGPVEVARRAAGRLRRLRSRGG